MRVFLDANILFSAAYLENSPATLLFDLEQAGRCILVTSAFARDEAHRNIGLKKPDRLPDLETLTARLKISQIPGLEALAVATTHGLPDKDAPILAAAMVARSEILVTGDRTHFGHLFGKQIDQLRVLTLANTLAFLIGKKGIAPTSRLGK